MPSSFSYKSITCDTKNNLQCFQSTTKPVLPNLDTPLSQNLYNKLRKRLCRTTTHLSPPSHSDLGTEEALLQKTRLSHLFFPSWGECSFTLFICTIYPPIVFQLYIPTLPYPWSFILSPLKTLCCFYSLGYNPLVPSVVAVYILERLCLSELPYTQPNSIIEGKVFEELEVVLGGDLTGGALAHTALFIKRSKGWQSGKGCRQTSLAHHLWTQNVQNECPHGWSMCRATKKLLQ